MLESIIKDKCKLNTVWFEMVIQCCPGSQHKRMPHPPGKCDCILWRLWFLPSHITMLWEKVDRTVQDISSNKFSVYRALDLFFCFFYIVKSMGCYQKTHSIKFLMTNTVCLGKIIGLIIIFFLGKLDLDLTYF